MEPVEVYKFYSDTNFTLCVESLDMRTPSNYFEVDYATSTVKFSVKPEDNVENIIQNYGGERVQ